MKKNLIFLMVIMLGVSAFTYAQAPLRINYQGVARNNFGTTINNKAISLRLSVRDGSSSGSIVYSERHAISTDQYGVFALSIGGGTLVSGSMAGINWATGTKFIQVEMDPNGGSAFISMGTSQLVSVPYSIIAGGAPPIGPAGGDLAGSTYPDPIIAPLVVTTGKLANAAVTTPKIADAAVTTIKLADNSVTTPKIVDLNVTTNKLADGAVTTVKIADGAVTSQKITVPFVKVQADASALINMTNTSASDGSSGISGSTNGNGASSFGVVGRANNGGFGVAGYSNSISVLGVAAAATGQAGRFETFNAANGSPTLVAWNGAGSGAAINAISLGTGPAGVFAVNNVASVANGVDVNVAGTGFALRAASTNAVPKALLTAGGLQLTGIGEAANRVLVSDATGNATWQTATAVGIVTGSGTTNFIPKYTPSGTNIGNSLLFDNGNSIGLGTITPSHRFNVTHAGSTGIGVNSTSGFSVVDIDAASGDAALRFGNAGVNKWNTRNEPVNNDYQWFEMGGGGERMRIQRGTGNIGISNNSPSARVHVTSNNTINYAVPTVIGSASGIVAEQNSASGANSGIQAYANGAGGEQYGVFGVSGGSSTANIGGLFLAQAASTGNNYGIFARAQGGATNRAGYFQGAVQIADGTQGVGKIFTDNGAGDGTGKWSTLAASGLVSGTGTATQVAFWNSASTITSNSKLFWDTTTASLGIGTATPAEPLHVAKAAFIGMGGQLMLENSGAPARNNQNSIDFVPIGWSFSSNIPGARILANDDGNYSSSVIFSTKNPGASGNSLTERMRISSGGNIGINNNNPNHYLDVAGTTIPVNSVTTGLTNSDHAFQGVGTGGIGWVGNNYSGIWANGTAQGAFGVYSTPGLDGIGVLGSQNGPGGYGVLCQGNGGYTGTWTLVSDAKFKKDFGSIDNALDKIKLLNPTTYLLKKDEYKMMQFPSERQYGFIAQELEKVFPTLVEAGKIPSSSPEASMEYKSVNYIGMIPVLTKAIQEQQKEIEDLKKIVQALINKK